LQSIPEELKGTIGPEEQIRFYLRQRIYHPRINIDSVLITTDRIFLLHLHALGIRKDHTDFNFRDISNVVLEKGVLRSTVRCVLRYGGEPLALSGLANSDAEQAYAVIRENLARYQAAVNGAA